MNRKKVVSYLVGALGIISLTFIYIYTQTQSESSKMPEDEMNDCQLHQQHQKEKKEKSYQSKHFSELNERGEREMGFSQNTTTHHFLMYSDGGAIQVEVNNEKDTDNLEKIRKHLAQVAESFTKGDFSTPLAVHAELPPGTKTMQLLKTKISYTYVETDKGAQVKIRTQDQVGLFAIYDFLRYQIIDHQTGDSLEITKN